MNNEAKLTEQEFTDAVVKYYIAICETTPPELPNTTDMVRQVADTASEKSYKQAQREIKSKLHTIDLMDNFTDQSKAITLLIFELQESLKEGETG